MENGSDEATKAELTRLLDLLTYSHEELQEISSPDPEANLDQGGRLARPSEQLGCTVGVDCLFYRTLSAGGLTFDVYYPQSPDATHGRWWLPYLSQVAEALGPTIARYQSMGLFTSTDIIFRPGIYAPDPQAFGLVPVGRLTPGATCQLELFVPIDGTAVLHNTIAHELFHCYQLHNFPAELRVRASEWWVESTAELYGELLFPDRLLAERIRQFDNAVVREKALTEMPYHGMVFFHYLQAARGDAGINEFMAAMPSSGNLNEQVKAFHEFSNMPIFFQLFAEDYFVKDIGLPVNPRLNTVAINSTIGFTDTFRPLTLHGAWLSYAPALGFDNVFSHGGFGYSSAYTEVAGWGRLPSQIGHECDPRNYLIVSTTTDPEVPFQIGLNITINATATCRTDACLIGTWEISAEDYMRPILDLLADPAEGGEYQGQVIYQFSADGTFTASFDMQADVFYRNTLGFLVIVRTKLNGIGTASYTLPEPSQLALHLASPEDFRINSETIVDIEGVTQTISNTWDPSDLEDGGTYSCGENYFMYSPTPVGGRPAMTWQFTKVP